MPNENVYTEAHGFKFPNGTTIPIEDAEARQMISNLIVTEKFTFDLGNIGAASYKRVQVDVSKNGYTPIGIIEISNTGTGDAWENIAEFYIETNNYAVITINNQLNATNYTLSGYFRVLYIKS